MTDSSAPVLRLTPAQEATLELIRRSGEPLVFDAEFVAELRDEANEALAHFTERLGGNTVFVNKHALAGVMACEAQFLAPDEFTWSPQRATGTVAHRALQLLVNWRGEPAPIDVVDEAIARLINEEKGLSDWLGGLGEGDIADLRGRASDHVTKFMECFPPLDPRSRPVTESGTQWPVDGPIVLRGRADLTMGKPAERESRKVIVDFKTGRVVARHREDLRFYALIETLSRQVPPRKLVSFYLDAATPIVEDVTENLLRSTLRRTLDGIDRMIQLRVEGRPATRTPGAPCRWCSLAAECAEGQAFLRGDDDHDVTDDEQP